METTLNIVSIIIIVFGVLQIILFFKVWGMTNNIVKIKDRVLENDYTSEACYHYLVGDIDTAEKLLNDAFLKEVSNFSQMAENWGEWENGYTKIAEKYKRAFKKIGRDEPDFEKFKDSNIYLL